MGILLLPFALLFLWALIFTIFIATKAAEGDTKKSSNKFWLKFFGLGIGCGLIFNIIFKFIKGQDILPQTIQESILPQMGFVVGLIIGVVYVLVTHERKN